ncbi:snoRNP complex protein nop56, partial [Podila epicladia]
MRDDGTTTTGIAEVRGASGAGAIAGTTTPTSMEALVLALMVGTLLRALTVILSTVMEAEVDTIPHGLALTTNATKDVNYFLYESSSGYALFERLESEEIGSKLADVAAAASDLTKFGKMVKLKSFAPFKSAAHALENMNDVSEGIMNDHLKAFLEMNLPKPGKKSKVVLGVTEKSLAGSIKEGLGYDVDASEIVLDLVRGVRLFGDKLLKQLKEGDLERAQLGLGHSYSRGKVKFNVHRSDNMIIQAIALLDQMDKDVNTFAMRIREWYSWHFPELVKIVNDNY